MTPRYPVTRFMLAACGFSWSLWLLMIASARGWVPFRFPTSFLGSFGPLIAAGLLCRSAGLAPGAREFFRSTLRGPQRGGWLLLALVGPIVLIGIAMAAHHVFAGPLPAPQALSRAYFLLPLFLVILLVGGPVGEEFGWRGYVLPLLLRRHRPIAASLVLAALWVTWHLPLFWLEGAAQEGSSIAAFALTVAGASILFTWVYLHTAPNLVAVLVLHTSINLFTFVLSTVLPAVDTSKAFNLALPAAFAVAALAVAIGDPRMRTSMS